MICFQADAEQRIFEKASSRDDLTKITHECDVIHDSRRGNVRPAVNKFFEDRLKNNGKEEGAEGVSLLNAFVGEEPKGVVLRLEHTKHALTRVASVKPRDEFRPILEKGFTDCISTDTVEGVTTVVLPKNETWFCC